MLTETTDYDKLCREFRWKIPERFNMATACCDRHADGSGRLALIYVDEDGGTSRTSFDDISEMSRRFANVLKADGLSRGDRVAVVADQTWIRQLAELGRLFTKAELKVFTLDDLAPARAWIAAD